MMFLQALIFFSAAVTVSHATSLRGGLALRDPAVERRLANAYYSTSDPTVLGAVNYTATYGNPLRGLHTSPRYTNGVTYKTAVWASLDFYYIGLDEVMTGDNTFDWSVTDKILATSAADKNHAIWRFFIDYPYSRLRLPKYLMDTVKIVPRPGGEASPQYDDPILLNAMKQFITALGARYDGHKSLAFIQLGLLGKWGEWHTYPEGGLVTQLAMDKVVEYYSAAFKTTKLQTRGIVKAAYAQGMGMHDDSFGYTTLGNVHWFFWPQVVDSKQADFWKKGPMGGETRPELQGTIFEPTYVPEPDWAYKQDFMQCVETTHATYMFHWAAFGSGAHSGAELENARHAHARMGYSFQVSNVAVAASSTANTVSVDVTVKQIGVAPFYYPLNLALTCAGTKETLRGVETLVDASQTKVFTFASIPADAACLSKIQVTLETPYAYADRPVKFAQGNGNVIFSLPLPQGSITVPSSLPEFILVDATTDVELFPLTNGAILDMSTLPPFTIVANPAASFASKSLTFTDNGTMVKVENSTPYAINGNVGKDFLQWSASLGQHTIVATPYSDKGAFGSTGPAISVTFNVVE